MSEIEIESFDSIQLAKIGGAVSAVMGVLLVLFYVPLALLAAIPFLSEPAALAAGAAAFLIISVITVGFYALVGMIGGFIFGKTYNYMQSKLGGVRIEIK